MNFICIHGHFYQPPRENPWLEGVEAQESAEPYHDWNQRITAECYAPNARSRILDDAGRIARLVNNYARISFNVGPTLLSWLEVFDPNTYAAILDADKQGQLRFGGHGPALAQVYNHAIMPLANASDKRTQVLWGLADFERRFGRPPEGVWLAEAAVDVASLEELAACDIKFTVLSPFQAARVRTLGGEWLDVRGGNVDTTQAYKIPLPSGRTIAAFFYDGPVSQAIAFEKLLSSGDKLAARLIGAIPNRTGPQLVHVATDGETYGHHFKFGDMALAYALDSIERDSRAKLTVYGEFLETAPPAFEVEIVEPSSWSCAHGVERWQADCGCKTGGLPSWSQTWRAPLRHALDALRDRLVPVFEKRGGELFADPWAARDEYIRVILDRSPETISSFFREHAGRALTPAETVRALSLLEMQRNCLLMYTSCGWFFDEISGIESVQVMAYAGRAAQLAESLGEMNVEKALLVELAKAKSNHMHMGDGRTIYERSVRPMHVNLAHVAAHFAIAALFEVECKSASVYCYDITVKKCQRRAGPNAETKLLVGRFQVSSRLTTEAAEVTVAAVHLGELNLRGGVRPVDISADERCLALETAFASGDLSEVLRILDDDFAAAKYSLAAVFHDERRRLLARMLEPTAQTMESAFRKLVNEHSSTMMIVQGLVTPLLPAFRNAARFVIQTDLRRAFDHDIPDLAAIARAAEDAAMWDLKLDPAPLNFAAQSAVARCVERLRLQPGDSELVKSCLRLLELMDELNLTPDLWQAQNVCYELAHSEQLTRATDSKQLIAALGKRLKVRVEDE